MTHIQHQVLFLECLQCCDFFPNLAFYYFWDQKQIQDSAKRWYRNRDWYCTPWFEPLSPVHPPPLTLGWANQAAGAAIRVFKTGSKFHAPLACSEAHILPSPSLPPPLAVATDPTALGVGGAQELLLPDFSWAAQGLGSAQDSSGSKQVPPPCVCSQAGGNSQVD